MMTYGLTFPIFVFFIVGLITTMFGCIWFGDKIVEYIITLNEMVKDYKRKKK